LVLMNCPISDWLWDNIVLGEPSCHGKAKTPVGAASH
jgi:hypothetical protein